MSLALSLPLYLHGVALGLAGLAAAWDWRTRTVPYIVDGAIWLTGVASLFLVPGRTGTRLMWAVFWMVIGYLAYRRGIVGGADPRLLAGFSLIHPLPSFLAYALIVVWGTIRHTYARRRGDTAPVGLPLGPYLALAWTATLLASYIPATGPNLIIKGGPPL